MLTSLTTPTVKPPTSLDMLGSEDDASGTSAPAGASATAFDAPAAPAQPSVNGLEGPDIGTFARNQMANPSRYDSSIVGRGIDLINQESERSKTRGMADLDEFYSSRGLVSSSIESQGRGDFLSQLNQAKEQRMFDLVREMANTYSQDVGTAGQLGLGARSQDLQQQGMNRDDAYRYALLEQSGGQFDRGMEFDRERLAAELGLSREQMDLQRDEMTAEYGDRTAARLHEMGLQEGSQEFAEAQNGLNRALEREALKLQREGMDAESAWREADRAIERRALDLQESGMAADEAYRRVVADQNARLSAADIYLRALAAGAGDDLPAGETLDYPTFPTFGGGGGGNNGQLPPGWDDIFNRRGTPPNGGTQPPPSGGTQPPPSGDAPSAPDGGTLPPPDGGMGGLLPWTPPPTEGAPPPGWEDIFNRRTPTAV